MPETGPGGPDGGQNALAAHLKRRGLVRTPQAEHPRIVTVGDPVPGPGAHRTAKIPFQTVSRISDPAARYVPEVITGTSPQPEPASSSDPSTEVQTNGQLLTDPSDNVVRTAAVTTPAPADEIRATMSGSGTDSSGGQAPGTPAKRDLPEPPVGPPDAAGGRGDGGTTDSTTANAEGDDDARARAFLAARTPAQLGRLAGLYGHILRGETSDVSVSRMAEGLGEIRALLWDAAETSRSRHHISMDVAGAEFTSSMSTAENIGNFLYPDLAEGMAGIDAMNALSTSHLEPVQVLAIKHTLQNRMDEHIARLREGEGMTEMGEASSDVLRAGSIREQLQRQGYRFDGEAEAMLRHSDIEIPTETDRRLLLRINIADLPIPSRTPTYDEVLQSAQQIGLELCPAWVAPAMLASQRRTRQKLQGSPRRKVIIAMHPIQVAPNRDPSVFNISENVLGSSPGTTVNIQDNLVFVNPITE